MTLLRVGQGVVDTGYEIEKSLRFRSSNLSYLSRVFGTPTNQNVFTYSCWCKRGALDTLMWLFSCTPSSNSGLMIDSTNKIGVYNANALYLSSVLLRDVSAHVHVLFALNGTSAKIEINGVLVYSATYTNTQLNVAGLAHYIGVMDLYAGGRYFFDGYLSDIHFIDGQALSSSSFGTNNVYGRWVAKKYTGTYGNNGFFLDFSDGTSLTTLGYDKSGNGNHWTLNGHSLTAGANYDWMDDHPGDDFAVLNSLSLSGVYPVADGGLRFNLAAGAYCLKASLPINVPIYFEFGWGSAGLGAQRFGVATAQAPSNTECGSDANGWALRINNAGASYGTWHSNALTSAGYSAGSTSDIGRCAVDPISGKIWFGRNGAWFNGGNPETGENPAYSNIPAEVFPAFSGNTWDGVVNFGQRPFAYNPPAGFKALSKKNLPGPSIKNPREHFNVVLHSTNGGATQVFTGMGFEADMLWSKSRANTYQWIQYDRNRGFANYLSSQNTDMEINYPSGVVSVDPDGFTLSTGFGVDASRVMYGWKAGGAAVANTDGSIASQVSANQEAGFSIVTYTGTGANATVGHGLGKAPKMIIAKRMTGGANSWPVWHQDVHNSLAGRILLLNSTDAWATYADVFNSAAPTSATIPLGNNAGNMYPSNGNGFQYVVYCFAEVEGFSKIDSYTGNGSADGRFVHCGFKPRFVLIKRVDASGFDWFIFDAERDEYNVVDLNLRPNTSGAESSQSANYLDFTENGFKLRGDGTGSINNNGGKFIFIAFA